MPESSKSSNHVANVARMGSGIKKLLRRYRLIVSSLPLAGPCNVCGKHTRKKCSVCWQLYCSADCQKQDWGEHKSACQPFCRGVSMPTDNDIDRAHRKAKVLLSMFWKQIKDCRRGKADPPQIRIDTHVDLGTVMSTEWMARRTRRSTKLS